MKRLAGILLILTLTLLCGLPVCADSVIPAERQLPLLVDNAGLLDSGEYDSLLRLLETVSNKYECEVAVVTVDSLGGKSAQAYADDFYDYNGYGCGSDDSGILLLVAMGEREWHITTYGYGIRAITDYGIDYLSGRFLDDLSDGYYYDAFSTFANDCGKLLEMARNGEPYDIGYREPYSVFNYLLPSLIVGLIAALIYTGVLKSQLKSVRSQTAAASYVVRDSLNLTDQRDHFLYRNVNKVRRSDDSHSGGGSRTHSSSSGRSHGGGGGRF
ncbi:MAG: TPM domain-containing protein [Clostridia bacterium]|nr:TPM domain-containing protein [Clostridia bacterium]